MKKKSIKKEKPKIINPKTMIATVVSDKMDKTVVVEVEQIKEHPKYARQYRLHKKFKAHDPQNIFKVGDKVQIVSSRPISKGKRWLVKKGVK